MSEASTVQGLSCPRCGGMVPVPEGQAIVICPFCDLRSVVAGERGVRRYQVQARIGRPEAEQAFKKFLSGKMAIARDTAAKARLTEAIQVHLPFWAAWGRGLGWVLGRERVGSGDNKRWEPREKRIIEEMDWNAAACDVGEFGVSRVSLTGRTLAPFQPDELHRTGMVFEPVGSEVESFRRALDLFDQRVRSKAGVDDVTQSFTRILRPRLGLVYYPLWVLRYTYRERAFQVVVDAFSGEVLYGKAPGNVMYRAAALVGGMAVGAFLAIDVPALILMFSNNSDDSPIGIALAIFAAGLGLMYAGYRTFRFGEHYEYRKFKEAGSGALEITFKDARKLLETVQSLKSLD